MLGKRTSCIPVDWLSYEMYAAGGCSKVKQPESDPFEEDAATVNYAFVYTSLILSASISQSAESFWIMQSESIQSYWMPSWWQIIAACWNINRKALREYLVDVAGKFLTWFEVAAMNPSSGLEQYIVLVCSQLLVAWRVYVFSARLDREPAWEGRSQAIHKYHCVSGSNQQERIY